VLDGGARMANVGDGAATMCTALLAHGRVLRSDSFGDKSKMLLTTARAARVVLGRGADVCGPREDSNGLFREPRGRVAAGSRRGPSRKRTQPSAARSGNSPHVCRRSSARDPPCASCHGPRRPEARSSRHCKGSAPPISNANSRPSLKAHDGTIINRQMRTVASQLTPEDACRRRLLWLGCRGADGVSLSRLTDRPTEICD